MPAFQLKHVSKSNQVLSNHHFYLNHIEFFSLTSWQLYACSGAIEVTLTVWVKRPIAEHNKTPQRADLLHISWEVLFPCFKFCLPAWYCLMFTALYYQYLSILYCHLQATDFQQRNSLIKLFYWQFEKHIVTVTCRGCRLQWRCEFSNSSLTQHSLHSRHTRTWTRLTEYNTFIQVNHHGTFITQFTSKALL